MAGDGDTEAASEITGSAETLVKNHASVFAAMRCLADDAI